MSPDAAETAPPRSTSADTRKEERFSVPTDVRLRKLGPGDVMEKEERTIAHDLSRSGMRVLTSWSDLNPGDRVEIEEVGGTFSTGAIVRHAQHGSDHITRAGIEFLEQRAPDRMVATTTSIKRPVFNSVQTRATASIPRPRSSEPAPLPGVTLSIQRPLLPRATPAPTPIPSGAKDSGGSATLPAQSLESLLDELANMRATAKALIGEARVWEALDCLAKAQALAEGTSEARAIHILTCETQARVPSLMRTAEQNLEELARTEPNDVAVHAALGRVFRQAGLSARARLSFKRVLSLDPSNREAATALAALGEPGRTR